MYSSTVVYYILPVYRTIHFEYTAFAFLPSSKHPGCRGWRSPCIGLLFILLMTPVVISLVFLVLGKIRRVRSQRKEILFFLPIHAQCAFPNPFKIFRRIFVGASILPCTERDFFLQAQLRKNNIALEERPRNGYCSWPFLRIGSG